MERRSNNPPETELELEENVSNNELHAQNKYYIML
jgi:hypothetical protein